MNLDKTKAIELLNKIMELELAGVVRYQPVVDTLPGETANCASCTAPWNTAGIEDSRCMRTIHGCLPPLRRHRSG